MTDYAKHTTRQPTADTEQVHISARERKAARKQVLDEVEQRRRDIYTRHYKKMQLQAGGKVL